MRERPNRHAWKACVGQLTVGSNPTPSAETARTLPGVDRVRLDELMGAALERARLGAGAVVAARRGLVAFGAAAPKAGALGSLYNLAADPRLNHEATVVDGARADECAALLPAFFADRR